MFLTLVRHGIAIDREDPACPPEAERFLTTQGIVRTEKAAKGIRRLGLVMQAAWSSPYVRAVETAEIVARALKFPPEEIRHTEALLPEAAPQRLFAELEQAVGVEHVFCFGHAPNLDLIVMHAVGATQPVTALKKAGLVVLELAAPVAGTAQIAELYPARALRTVAER